MIRYLIVWARRLLIFIPGIIVAYVAFLLFPDIDKPIPLTFAILLTYCLVAYFAIPLVWRLIHFIHKPKHIPLYSTTPDGLPANPVHICLVGTEAEVKRAMRRAGWYEADGRSLATMARMAFAVLFRRSYVNAPFSSLYLFDRKQDFGFQIPVGTSPFKRHHIRFWEVNYHDKDAKKEDVDFWHALSAKAPTKKPKLWVGAATYDRGLGITLHNAQIDHMIHGDTNAERDFVVSTLRETGLVASTKKLRAGRPYTLRDRVLGVRVIADGEIILVNLRRLHSPLTALSRPRIPHSDQLEK